MSIAVDQARSLSTSPLRMLQDLQPHASMLQAPGTLVDARERVAYWLYVAARLALGRGDTATANALRARADGARQAAGLYSTGVLALVPWLTGAGSGVAQVPDVLSAGAVYAAEAGQPDVAEVLRRLSNVQAVAQSAGAVEAERGLLSRLPGYGRETEKDKKKRDNLYKAAGASIVVLGLLVVLRPYVAMLADRRRPR